MKLIRSFISGLGLVGILFTATISFPLPPPPDTPPPPDNQTKPGGGLDPEESACHNREKSLTALIPLKNPVLTTASHPKILIYIPDEPQDLLRGEFWLNDLEGKTRIYKAIRFKFLATPGIISISLPDLPESALIEGQYYPWYFKIYCRDNSPNRPNFAVKGWVKRVSLTPERQQLIALGKPDIWYDALATLYEHLQQFPNDHQSQEKWNKLLQSIDTQELAKEPINSSIILIPE